MDGYIKQLLKVRVDRNILQIVRVYIVFVAKIKLIINTNKLPLHMQKINGKVSVYFVYCAFITYLNNVVF